MEAIGELKNRWFEYFTEKRYGGIVGSEDFHFSNGEIMDLAYFSDSDSLTIGQKIPFTGSIVVNKPIFSNLSKETQEYILYHELSHLNRTSIARGIFWGLILFATIILGYNLTDWLKLAIGLPFNPVALFTETFLMVLVIIITYRVEETTAEIQALRKVGETVYFNAQQELNNSRRPSFVGRLQRFIGYPNPKSVVKIESFLKKLGI